MTADPTPAADPRLAELAEALLGSGIAYSIREGTGWKNAEEMAAAILALLPARTATTEAVALAAAPTPEELDDICARIGATGYASDAVAVFEDWTRARWGVESAFTTQYRAAALAASGGEER